MHNSIHTNRLNIFGKFDKKREYFAKFVERKKVQLYFSFVLMPTYPLGRHMRRRRSAPLCRNPGMYLLIVQN